MSRRRRAQNGDDQVEALSRYIERLTAAGEPLPAHGVR